MKSVDVLIIGGGPAGATAALYASRAQLSTVVVDKSLTSGALGMTGKVENFPGLPTSSGPEIVQAIRDQAHSFGAAFEKAQVNGVMPMDDKFMVVTSTEDFEAKTIILATGSMERSKSVPGEDDFIGRGVSYCATCDAAFFKQKTVAVIGSNDQAVEEALFLTRFAKTVKLLFQSAELKAAQDLIEEAKENPQIELYPRTSMLSVHGEKKVTHVQIRREGEEQRMELDGVFIFLAGNKPAISFLNGLVETSESGCVLVNRDTHMTNVPGIFAVGDLLCSEVKQAVIACAEGCIAAVQADKFIRGRDKVKHDWK